MVIFPKVRSLINIKYSEYKIVYSERGGWLIIPFLCPLNPPNYDYNTKGKFENKDV